MAQKKNLLQPRITYQFSEGGIYPRKDGRYTAQIYIDGDRVTYTSTEEKASAWLKKVKAELTLGVYVKPEKKQSEKKKEDKPRDELSLGEWLDNWLELYAKNSIKLATYISYETYIRRHIKPALGQIPIKELTIGDLQKFLTDKLVQGRADGQEGGLSAKTVRNIHKMLLPALEQAKVEGILTENLAAGVNPPKVEQKEMRVLSLEEQKRFVAACTHLQRGGAECVGVYGSVILWAAFRGGFGDAVEECVL